MHSQRQSRQAGNCKESMLELLNYINTERGREGKKDRSVRFGLLEGWCEKMPQLYSFMGLLHSVGSYGLALTVVTHRYSH